MEGPLLRVLIFDLMLVTKNNPKMTPINFETVVLFTDFLTKLTVKRISKAYIQLYYIQHDTTLHYAGHSQTPN